MASIYTPNYNFDLYAGADKPNLRDQYNAAIGKIDTQLKNTNNNVTVAVESANQAAAGVAAVKKEAADALALAQTNEADIAANDADIVALKAEDSRLSGLINQNSTKINANGSSISGLDTRVKKLEAGGGRPPKINTDDIVDGAVTAPKLAQSAINAILQNLTVRVFDNEDPTADNDGLVAESQFGVGGFYIEDLQILVINKYINYSTMSGSKFAGSTLPSYVPRPNKKMQSGLSFISWGSGKNFDSWSGLTINSDGSFGTSSALTGNVVLSNAAVFYMGANAVGASVDAAPYSALVENNGMI